MAYLSNKSGTVEPCFATTALLRPSHNYCRFILSQIKAQSVIFLFKEPLIATTLLKWPDFYGPLVTGLTGFHCMY